MIRQSSLIFVSSADVRQGLDLDKTITISTILNDAKPWLLGLSNGIEFRVELHVALN